MASVWVVVLMYHGVPDHVDVFRHEDQAEKAVRAYGKDEIGDPAASLFVARVIERGERKPSLGPFSNEIRRD